LTAAFAVNFIIPESSAETLIVLLTFSTKRDTQKKLKHTLFLTSNLTITLLTAKTIKNCLGCTEQSGPVRPLGKLGSRRGPPIFRGHQFSQKNRKKHFWKFIKIIMKQR